MPTYDYRCEAGHRYERREPFGSPTTHDCQRCGRQAVRQLSAPPLVFKGSGWYVTESRGRRSGGSAHASSSSNGDGATASESKGTASTDSKSKDATNKGGAKRGARSGDSAAKSPSTSGGGASPPPPGQ